MPPRVGRDIVESPSLGGFTIWMDKGQSNLAIKVTLAQSRKQTWMTSRNSFQPRLSYEDKRMIDFTLKEFKNCPMSKCNQQHPSSVRSSGTKSLLVFKMFPVQYSILISYAFWTEKLIKVVSLYFQPKLMETANTSHFFPFWVLANTVRHCCICYSLETFLSNHNGLILVFI